jgi:hypothetical protein
MKDTRLEKMKVERNERQYAFEKPKKGTQIYKKMKKRRKRKKKEKERKDRKGEENKRDP